MKKVLFREGDGIIQQYNEAEVDSNGNVDHSQYMRRLVVIQAVAGVTKEDIVKEFESKCGNTHFVFPEAQIMETVNGQDDMVVAEMTINSVRRTITRVSEKFPGYNIESFAEEMISARDNQKIVI